MSSEDPGTEPSAELKGQAQRGAQRRAAIIDAALDVFATRGFRGSALAEIAERVDVTPAGILYHFGSKEALLLAVIEERDRRATDFLASLNYEGGIESLRQLVRIAEMCEAERGLAALHTVLQIESFEPGDPAHKYFWDRSRLVRRWLEQSLALAQRGGQIRGDVNCRAKANQFVAFQEGAAVLWLMDDAVSLVDLYREYIEDFLCTIMVPPKPDEPTG